MIPGVTHLPAPSTTAAPAGASTVWPTAAILPPCISTEPRSMRSPAAVSTVALVIRTGWEGRGW